MDMRYFGSAFSEGKYFAKKIKCQKCNATGTDYFNPNKGTNSKPIMTKLDKITKKQSSENVLLALKLIEMRFRLRRSTDINEKKKLKKEIQLAQAKYRKLYMKNYSKKYYQEKPEIVKSAVMRYKKKIRSAK